MVAPQAARQSDVEASKIGKSVRTLRGTQVSSEVDKFEQTDIAGGHYIMAARDSNHSKCAAVVEALRCRQGAAAIRFADSSITGQLINAASGRKWCGRLFVRTADAHGKLDRTKGAIAVRDELPARPLILCSKLTLTVVAARQLHCTNALRKAALEPFDYQDH